MNEFDERLYKTFSTIIVVAVLLIGFGLLMAALLGVWSLLAWLWVVMI